MRVLAAGTASNVTTMSEWDDASVRPTFTGAKVSTMRVGGRMPDAGCRMRGLFLLSGAVRQLRGGSRAGAVVRCPSLLRQRYRRVVLLAGDDTAGSGHPPGLKGR
jgi:hypothetical protein